jgi:hypothetical protein
MGLLIGGDHPQQTHPYETRLAPLGRTNGNAPVGARNGLPSPDARARLLASAEITRVVEQLVCVGNELAREAYSFRFTSVLDPLKQLAMGYDLDNLMVISSRTLNSGVIAFYRDVLVLTNALERNIRSAARIRVLEHGDRLLEQDQEAFRDRVAAAVTRGDRIAQSLDSES